MRQRFWQPLSFSSFEAVRKNRKRIEASKINARYVESRFHLGIRLEMSCGWEIEEQGQRGVNAQCRISIAAIWIRVIFLRGGWIGREKFNGGLEEREGRQLAGGLNSDLDVIHKRKQQHNGNNTLGIYRKIESLRVTACATPETFISFTPFLVIIFNLLSFIKMCTYIFFLLLVKSFTFTCCGKSFLLFNFILSQFGNEDVEISIVCAGSLFSPLFNKPQITFFFC